MENRDVLNELVDKLAEVRLQLDDIQSKIDELLRQDALNEPEVAGISVEHEDFLSGISDETVPVSVSRSRDDDSELETEIMSAPEAEAGAVSGMEIGAGEEAGKENRTEAESGTVSGMEPETGVEADSAEPGSENVGSVAHVASDVSDTVSDGPESLFGGLVEEKSGLHRRAVNDRTSAPKAVIDMKPERPEWYSAIPGPEVKDIRSAISLNDRVMFITSLFREDSMLFQDVVSRINSMTSMEKVVEYVSELFPEWDMYSDMVGRFMMAVRRKLR